MMLESVPPLERILERNRDRDRSVSGPLLHNAVATSLPDCDESVMFEKLADLVPGKDAQPTQQEPRLA